MGRKIKDVTTIDVVQKDYKVPISNLVTPKAYSASLEQIADLTMAEKVLTFTEDEWERDYEGKDAKIQELYRQHGDCVIKITEGSEPKVWVIGDALPIILS